MKTHNKRIHCSIFDMGWRKRLGCATAGSLFFGGLCLYLLHVGSAYGRNVSNHWAESTAAFKTIRLCENDEQVKELNLKTRCDKDREWRENGFWIPMWYLTVDEECAHWSTVYHFLPAASSLFAIGGYLLGRFPEYAILTVPYFMGIIALLGAAFKRIVIEQWLLGMDERQQQILHDREIMASLLRAAADGTKSETGKIMNLPSSDARAFDVWSDVPAHNVVLSPPPRATGFRLEDRDRV
jgi:hypothetical protein